MEGVYCLRIKTGTPSYERLVHKHTHHLWGAIERAPRREMVQGAADNCSLAKVWSVLEQFNFHALWVYRILKKKVAYRALKWMMFSFELWAIFNASFRINRLTDKVWRTLSVILHLFQHLNRNDITESGILVGVPTLHGNNHIQFPLWLSLVVCNRTQNGEVPSCPVASKKPCPDGYRNGAHLWPLPMYHP